MRKIFFALIIVVLFLTACGSDPAPIPWEQISFVVEENPDYVGSYSLTRSSAGQDWVEWGEWTSIEKVVSDTTVCFGYFGDQNYATFRSRSDYEWVEVNKDGRLCLRLQKRK